VVVGVVAGVVVVGVIMGVGNKQAAHLTGDVKPVKVRSHDEYSL